MKKLLSVFCLLAMLIGVFAACEAHEHEFESDWSSDDDYHWHACVAIDGCPEEEDKEEHDFEVVLNKKGNPINKCKVCGETNSNVSSATEHEHTYEDKLTASDNFHGYPCTAKGCYEMKDKSEHVFGNPEITYADSKITFKYVCVDCAFEKVEEQKVKTEVDDALSWDNAFKNFKLTNFTMDVYQKHGEYTNHNHCVVTEKDAYYCIPDSNEFYTVPNGDGTYTTYQRHDSDDPFTIRDDTSNQYLIGAQTETVIQISFEDNFDKFTYDEKTASYVCDEPIEANYYSFEGELYGTLHCYQNVVKITDGKISYIEAHYYFDEKVEDEEYSFTYYNIGMSVVEVPQSVIDQAIRNPAQEKDPFKKIRVNLVIKDGSTTVYEGDTLCDGTLGDAIENFCTDYFEEEIVCFDENDILKTIGELTAADGKRWKAWYEEEEGQSKAFESIKTQPLLDGKTVVICLE